MDFFVGRWRHIGHIPTEYGGKSRVFAPRKAYAFDSRQLMKKQFIPVILLMVFIALVAGCSGTGPLLFNTLLLDDISCTVPSTWRSAQSESGTLYCYPANENNPMLMITHVQNVTNLVTFTDGFYNNSPSYDYEFTTIDGIDAISALGKDSDLNLYTLDAFLVGSTIYIFSLTAPESDFDTYYPAYKEILNSIRIGDPPA